MAKRVPAALHSELSEYASLVRSLQTSSVLDLSTQVSQFGASSSRSSQFEDGDDDDDDDEVDQLDPTEDEDEGEKLDGKKARKTSKTHILTARQKEIQSAHSKTRWPLRPAKAPHPEFQLRDEVQAVVDSHRRRNCPSIAEYNFREPQKAGSSESENGEEMHEADVEYQNEPRDAEDDFDSDVEDGALPVLTSLTAAYLRNLLDACAAHVPKVSSGMHNRLLPMDWKGVLNAASSAGTVPPDVIDRVEGRLRTMYSSEKENIVREDSNLSFIAAARLGHLHSIQEHRELLIAASMDAGDSDLLRIVGPQAVSPTKQRRKRKVGTPPNVSENT